MAKTAGRPRAAKLSEEKIVSAALGLCQNQGVEQMSLRTLAASLGVDPMAIYHYFPNRNAVLAATLEHAFADLPKNVPMTKNWQGNVTSLLQAYRTMAVKNSGLMLHLLATPDGLPPALVAFNALLSETLAASGADSQRVRRLRDILIDYTHGYALAERHFSAQQRRQSRSEYGAAIALILLVAQ